MEQKPNAAERLRLLYEQRVPSEMSQAEFGKTYGIGTQGMVWQYLSGHRPLNLDAAAKFAKGLRCTIADISPELARHVRLEIFPVLGRVSLKAAIALVLGLPALLPSKSMAEPIISASNQAVYYVKRLIDFFARRARVWHRA